jgi:hypothetical protein
MFRQQLSFARLGRGIVVGNFTLFFAGYNRINTPKSQRLPTAVLDPRVYPCRLGSIQFIPFILLVERNTVKKLYATTSQPLQEEDPNISACRQASE